ncbi:DUF1045 domain-containing protein [Clavibacter tessellarius]
MTRVAVYAIPGIRADDATGITLRERAEAWLGRSVVGGSPAPAAAAPAGWTRAEVDAITVDARRYGFHGTLKAPLRLAAGRDLAGLDAAVADLAGARDRIALPGLRVASLSGFLALVPTGPAPALDALAADAVTGLDGFRAPPTDAETARRDPASLSPRQREAPRDLGLPARARPVPLPPDPHRPDPARRASRVEAALADWFAGGTDRPVAIDALAVVIEDAPGAPFRLHAVHPLRAPHRPDTTPHPRATPAPDPEGPR